VQEFGGNAEPAAVREEISRGYQLSVPAVQALRTGQRGHSRRGPHTEGAGHQGEAQQGRHFIGEIKTKHSNKAMGNCAGSLDDHLLALPDQEGVRGLRVHRFCAQALQPGLEAFLQA
jgi:hypothetical protein